MNNFFDGSQIVIGHGAQADVYSYQGYAYKVYKDSYPIEWIEFEKHQQSQINKVGLSPIRYYNTENPYIIKMDLIEGDTLGKKMTEGYTNGFGLIADIFRNIHNADPSDVKIPLLLETVDRGLNKDEKEKVIQIIERLSAKMSSCICHLDMHFLNVMIPTNDTNPIIIDWINSRIAPAVFDYARTYVIFKEFAQEILPLYEQEIASDIRSLKVSDEDFADAITVCSILREQEK
ncbi:MAG: phosphotransferase [Eubacterium sp.]|nr:phosphotransferase [Eubacterium sp.]